MVGIVPDETQHPAIANAVETQLSGEAKGKHLIGVVHLELFKAIARRFSAIGDVNEVAVVAVATPTGSAKNLAPCHGLEVCELPVEQCAQALMSQLVPAPIFVVAIHA